MRGLVERLDREHDVEVGRVGDRVVQADGRVARGDQPVRRLPRDRRTGTSAIRSPASTRSSLAPALRVEVLAHDVEVGDLAAEHAVERRAAAEQRRRVGLAHPFVGAALRREEDLQRRVDAEQVRQPLEQMPVERRRPCPASTGRAWCGRRRAASSARRPRGSQASARRKKVRSAAPAARARGQVDGGGMGLRRALMVGDRRAPAGPSRFSAEPSSSADKMQAIVRARTTGCDQLPFRTAIGAFLRRPARGTTQVACTRPTLRAVRLGAMDELAGSIARASRRRRRPASSRPRSRRRAKRGRSRRRPCRRRRRCGRPECAP